MTMTTIGLMATDQQLIATEQPKVASGDQNSVLLTVDLDNEWDGYTASAVFFNEGENVDIFEVLLVDNQCIIPHEVLDEAGVLYIGIRGVDTDKNRIKTSTLVKYKVEEGTPAGDATTVPPTADVYQQLLALSVETKDIAQSVRDDFDAGAIPALQEQNKKAGFMFWVGTKAEYKAQKDTLPENVLCIVTDDTTEADMKKAIETLQSFSLTMGDNRTDFASGSNLNNFTSVGAYRCYDGTVLSTLLNCPVKKQFTLDVVSANGLSLALDGPYRYLLQKFNTYDGEQYVRMLRTNGDSVFTAEKWKKVTMDVDFVDLGTAPIQHNVLDFAYFMGLNYDDYGNVSKSVLFTVNTTDYDALERTVTGCVYTDIENNIRELYQLYFYWGSGGYMMDASFTTVTGSTTGNVKVASFDKIVGFKTPILGV